MSLKFAALTAIASLAAGAVASFDLMLIPGSDGRVHRYDPVNGVSLGSFAGQNPLLVATNGAGVSYSCSGFGAFGHAYSTGQSLGSWVLPVNPRSLEYADGALFGMSSTTLRKVDTVTGASTNVTLSSSVAWQSLTSFGTTLIAIGINTSNVITYQTLSTATLTLSATSSAGVSVAPGTALGKAGFTFNPGVPGSLPQFAFSYVNTSSQVSFIRSFLSGGSPVTTTPFTITGFTSTNSMPSVLAGHNGYWIYGQDSTVAANARIARIDIVSSSFIPGASTTITAPGGSFSSASYYHPGIVIAPEPAAFMPLGLGLLLMRRRKRK
ncbi:MAG: hypothetical protein IT205_05090 [Fimbriimonadaceae bacterium]|nr:hypothetical protein [Fimbriimonadaceae bacterium]